MLLTGLPSIYLAAKLVDNEVFKSRARDFVRKEFQAARVHVLDTRLVPAKQEIEVTLIGPRLPASAIAAIEARLPAAGLRKARLSVHQAQAEDSKPIDVGSLKAEILADIVRNNQQALQDKDTAIAALRQQLTAQQGWVEQAAAVTREFEAQYPQCGNVLVGRAVLPGANAAGTAPFLSADCRRLPKADEVRRIEAWLKVRTGNADVKLVLAAARGKIVRHADSAAQAPAAQQGAAQSATSTAAPARQAGAAG